MTEKELTKIKKDSLAKDLYDVLHNNTRLSNEKALVLVEKIIKAITKPQHTLDLLLTSYTKAIAGGAILDARKKGYYFARGDEALLEAASEYDEVITGVLRETLETIVDDFFDEHTDYFLKE